VERLADGFDTAKGLEVPSANSSPSVITSFAISAERQKQADKALAMMYYTTNTPPERVNSTYQQRYSAILGHKSPSAKDLRGYLLDESYETVKRAVMQSLEDTKYAIVTDGWSKRAAQRGTPLINVMVCPDDGPAVFWKVVNAAGQIKDAQYVFDLHKELRLEVDTALPNAQFVGYVMDSTATNRKAMNMLHEDDPAICVLPCASHALSLVIKHTAKYFSWVDDVYTACCAISEKLINAEKLRYELHSIQRIEYNCVKGICAHVPTRFGSRHLVLKDIVASKEAIKKLSATQVWRDAVTKCSVPLRKAHDMLSALENDLFFLAEKVEELLGPVMDAIHTLEADQPMLSYLSSVYDSLRANFDAFGKENPLLADGEIPADKRKKNSAPTVINLLASFDRDREFIWRPVMSAAAILDPLNWCVNGMGKYHVPVQQYSSAMQEELVDVVKAFENAEESAEDEIVELECFVFEGKYTNKLNKLTEKRVVKVGGRNRTEVSNHKTRLGFFHNFLSKEFPVCARACTVLMSMPVTACASERNWSKWGLTFVPNRNALGIESAQKVIYIQQNDPSTRIPRGIAGADTYVD
jgi:Protein of unknown function (DUF 659)/hAT family C-terminal dimerisation region